jgi:hypothetical protein
MILHTFYSKSHEILFEKYFKPSIRDKDLKLIADKIPQESSGLFLQDNWNLSMQRKLRFCEKLCYGNEIFIHADADVQFFQKLKDKVEEILNDCDIAFQDDGHALCAGLFCAKPSKELAEIFKKARLMVKNKEVRDDQIALNKLLKEQTKIIYKILPSNWWSHGVSNFEYFEGQEVYPPDNIIAHHANWTYGVKNKLLLLEKVKRSFNSKKIIGFNLVKSYPYPSYHLGPTLEEYACEYFRDDNRFLSIYWTRILNCTDQTSKENEINKIKLIEKNKQYFTISTHDDAPYSLSSNIKSFSAGGNKKNCIPIPLVASKLPYEPQEKTLLAHFCGSETHPIRNELKKISNKDGFHIELKTWSNYISKEQEIKNFDIMAKAKFALCPRGYGPTSFRLYESLHLDCIPVYISDNHYLPFRDEIEWNEMCVLAGSVEEAVIKIEKISDKRRLEMLNYMREKRPLLTDFKLICQKINSLI